MHSFLLIAILGQFSMGRIDGHLQKMNGVLPNSDPPLSTASFTDYSYLSVPSLSVASAINDLSPDIRIEACTCRQPRNSAASLPHDPRPCCVAPRPFHAALIIVWLLL
jgi:hypothetical protein